MIDVIHYTYVTMGVLASQIISISTVFSNVCSCAHQKEHQRSALLAFVREIQRWQVVSSHKAPVTRKMFPFNDVIMNCWLVWIVIGSTEKLLSIFMGSMWKCFSLLPLSAVKASVTAKTACNANHWRQIMVPWGCGCNFKNVIFILIL